MQNLLFKNYEKYQHDESRALNQVWSPSKYRVLGDCKSHKPLKLAFFFGLPNSLLYDKNLMRF